MKKRHFCRLFFVFSLFFLFFFHTSLTHGKILNIEKLRPEMQKKAGLHGALESDLSFTNGNSKTRFQLFNAQLAYARHRSSLSERTDHQSYQNNIQRIFLFTGQNEKEWANKVVTVNNETYHLRWTEMHLPNLGHETFFQYQSNEFTKLVKRIIIGAGARYEFDLWEKIFFAVGLGLFHEQETKNIDSSDTNEKVRENLYRWSSYLTFRTPKIWDIFSLTSISYFQPRIDRSSDYRFTEIFEFDIALNSYVGLSLSLEINFDNKPPLGVKKSDVVTSKKLVIKF